MEILNDNTNILLILIALLLVSVLALQAFMIQDTQSFQTTEIGSADTVGYAVHNPTLRQELHARYVAPEITQQHEQYP
jgi:hypothetical protein